MASHVVSKKRVADHGEVYTREKEVKAMLDLAHQETLRIESRFLEPACGTKSNKNDENDAEGVCEAVTRGPICALCQRKQWDNRIFRRCTVSVRGC